MNEGLAITGDQLVEITSILGLGRAAVRDVHLSPDRWQAELFVCDRDGKILAFGSEPVLVQVEGRVR